jgi:hypothetical protein
MTDKNVGSIFLIDDGRLFIDSDTDGRREITHVCRIDGGGAEYLRLRVSDGKVLGGRTVSDTMFSLSVTPDGRLEGKVPGGYQYDFVSDVK